MSDNPTEQGDALSDSAIVLSQGILTMPIPVYVALHATNGALRLHPGNVTPARRAHLDALLEVGLVMRREIYFSPTEAGVQVMKAAIRTERDRSQDTSGSIRIDMRALGW
ncbi:hypothetical protein [Planctomyces sp. SH-PL14]|uniref:hypothetical protein n=1 Tax=Planctomyces sp. SH-PL14 TaxID=1632864 RepID=UPI00078BD6FD|nr:hypothetical protein [Planctomyces sp. SH-PL14]AMV16955.1 hypothetical protein VT03_03635 [Planctomyces sp. SH-PL14]